MSTVLPEEIRRANLKRVVQDLGGHGAVAKRLKLAGSSWVSQLIQGLRPFTEKTARKFEKGLGLHAGALDVPGSLDGPPRGTGYVNRDVPSISETWQCVDSALTRRKQMLSKAQLGVVVDIVFSQVVKHGTVDAELTEKVLDLLQI